jgi:predicted secreted protein
MGVLMRKFLFAAVAILLSGAAFADNIVVTTANNGGALTLKVGQCIDVRLSTQAASTGYQWYLAPGMPEIMNLSARTVTVPGDAMPGSPSQLDYILCAAAPGELTVKFLNYRPWEKNIPPAQTLSFTVKIEK